MAYVLAIVHCDEETGVETIGSRMPNRAAIMAYLEYLNEAEQAEISWGRFTAAAEKSYGL